jgi:hypothetical protein
MADLHSTPDTDETGTERSLIVGYRPKVHDKTTPILFFPANGCALRGLKPDIRSRESHERLHCIDGI